MRWIPLALLALGCPPPARAQPGPIAEGAHLAIAPRRGFYLGGSVGTRLPGRVTALVPAEVDYALLGGLEAGYRGGLRGALGWEGALGGWVGRQGGTIGRDDFRAGTLRAHAYLGLLLLPGGAIDCGAGAELRNRREPADFDAREGGNLRAGLRVHAGLAVPRGISLRVWYREGLLGRESVDYLFDPRRQVHLGAVWVFRPSP